MAELDRPGPAGTCPPVVGPVRPAGPPAESAGVAVGAGAGDGVGVGEGEGDDVGVGVGDGPDPVARLSTVGRVMSAGSRPVAAGAIKGAVGRRNESRPRFRAQGGGGPSKRIASPFPRPVPAPVPVSAPRAPVPVSAPRFPRPTVDVTATARVAFVMKERAIVVSKRP